MNVPVDGVSEDPEEFERHRNQEFAMRVRLTQCLSVLAVGIAFWGCRDQPTTSAPSTTVPLPSATAPTDDADPADDAVPAPTVRFRRGARRAPPLEWTGCAPATRCIRVSTNGRPQASGTSIAQCRGEFASRRDEPWLDRPSAWSRALLRIVPSKEFRRNGLWCWAFHRARASRWSSRHDMRAATRPSWRLPAG